MADGTYAVQGMFAKSNFGEQVISTPTRNIVFSSLSGSFVSEAQLENELPYGAQITIYDSNWNLIREIQQYSKIDDWVTYRFVPTGSTTPSSEGTSQIFVIDDRWIVYPAGYTRNWKNNSWYHYGRSYAFLDLDNLDNLEYDDVNAYGISHTYTNISFIITTDIPRYQFSAKNLQVVTVDGKQKLINTQYSSHDNDTYVPAVWIHDVETMINAGLSNLGGGVMVESEHSFDVFVGDGTTKQLIKERSDVFGGDYPITVPEGFGPESGTVVGPVPYPVITANTDQLVVSDGYKSEVYEYANGSWSTPVIVSKSFSDGQLSESTYFVDGKVYYDFVNNPESFIEYSGSQLYKPFDLTEPTSYPLGVWADPITVTKESGSRRLLSSYGNGNLSQWISQYVRRVQVIFEYSFDGTYVVKGSNNEGIHTLSSGRWLERSMSSGESYELSLDLESISSDNPNISVVLNDTRKTITGGTESFTCTIQETDLNIDPSTPIQNTVVFKSTVKGISKVSTSEHMITFDATLSGIANPGLELTDPNVVMSLSSGAAYGGSDTDHYAVHIMKPQVVPPDNQQGYTDELLLIDSSTESVEFLILGDALEGQQLTLEFGDGWVDTNGDPLGTVVIDLREDGLKNTISELTYVANIGTVTSGQDLSVTASSFFGVYNQYQNIDQTFTKTIPIQVS